MSGLLERVALDTLPAWVVWTEPIDFEGGCARDRTCPRG
jgi:hypothetical protein